MEAIYDTIGEDYDTTRKVDPEILATLSALLDIKVGENYLDIACGTGNYTNRISRLGGTWFACDGSEKMLYEARSKSSDIKWMKSDVLDLKYDSNFFDGAICSLAIHHFPDLTLSFGEISRVLKSTSNFVIFTSTPAQMKGYWLNHYFPEMMEKSCKQMPSLEQVNSALMQTGFSIQTTVPFFITHELKDFFLYSGKQRPEMYLSHNVRNGISSFHKFCSQSELNQGLEKMQRDITSGEIKRIMESYENKNGDYLFICATTR
ncbi:MAG: ubiquinone/menaquinone biosynthesis C-methylase UbiE [Gammaproteobacteria bacterium]|jgi:ubiquinone/menaquinone biosynthesis C-methylase UbiE